MNKKISKFHKMPDKKKQRIKQIKWRAKSHNKKLNNNQNRSRNSQRPIK